MNRNPFLLDDLLNGLLIAAVAVTFIFANVDVFFDSTEEAAAAPVQVVAQAPAAAPATLAH